MFFLSTQKTGKTFKYLSDYSCWCRYNLLQLPPAHKAVTSYQKENLNIFIYMKPLNIRHSETEIHTVFEG